VRPTRTLASPLALAATLSLAACADGGGTRSTTEVPEQPTPAGQCTGAVPANAMLCPGADRNLAADAPRVLQNACTCDASCHQKPCSYVCNAGFVLLDGACTPAGQPGQVEVVDLGDGTVRVTGTLPPRIWLKEADCRETAGGVPRADGAVTYVDAVAWALGLHDGMCGLRDGSAAGGWRLPDDSELVALALDLGTAGPDALATFSNVRTRGYWNTFSTCTGIYGVVELTTARYSDVAGTNLYDVLPVRDAP
jgi:hypothetical protein